MKKSLVLVSLAALLVGLLAGCANSNGQQALVPGSSLVIGEAGVCASANPGIVASTGSTTAAQDIAQLTLPAFYSHDAAGALIANTEFGSVKRVTSQDVVYTLTGKAQWSDGVAVTPADLAVSWLAATDNTPSSDGTQVGFASALRQTSLALANKAILKADSIRLHFTQPVPDWQTALPLTVPAHLLAQLALPNSGLSTEEAQQVVLDLATGASTSNRGALAQAFATSFNAPAAGKLPGNLLLSAGAYRFKSFAAGRVQLVANQSYEVGPKAAVESLTVSCFATADELATAVAAKKVDLASPSATTMYSLAQLQSKAKDAGLSTALGDSGQNEVILLNYGKDSAFTAGAWGGDAKQAAAAAESFFKFVPRSGIWSQLAGDSSLKKSDSLVFGSSDSEYQSSVNQNGTNAYQFQDAESSAEGWQKAKFDRTIKLRVLFDATGSRGQLEYSQLSRLGKLGGFDLQNVSSDNVAAVLATGQWDVLVTSLGRLGHDNQALATAVGALTGFQNSAAGKMIALTLANSSRDNAAADTLVVDSVGAKNFDQLLIQSYYGLPLFELSRLVVWSSALQNYQPTVGNNSVVWGYSNWSVSGKGK